MLPTLLIIHYEFGGWIRTRGMIKKLLGLTNLTTFAAPYIYGYVMNGLTASNYITLTFCITIITKMNRIIEEAFLLKIINLMKNIKILLHFIIYT